MPRCPNEFDVLADLDSLSETERDYWLARLRDRAREEFPHLVSGAGLAAANDAGTAVDRLSREVHLQRAFRHLAALGPRPVGCFVAELLDQLGAHPDWLDVVLDWMACDPTIISAIGASTWPPSRPRLVPEDYAGDAS